VVFSSGRLASERPRECVAVGETHAGSLLSKTGEVEGFG